MGSSGNRCDLRHATTSQPARILTPEVDYLIASSPNSERKNAVRLMSAEYDSVIDVNKERASGNRSYESRIIVASFVNINHHSRAHIQGRKVWSSTQLSEYQAVNGSRSPRPNSPLENGCTVCAFIYQCCVCFRMSTE